MVVFTYFYVFCSLMHTCFQLKDRKYREALGKWEAALNVIPDSAVLHEQKAQVLLEIGDAWNALRSVAGANELEPSWAEAWITLGRAQLNFGEPDSAIESFDRALAIKPDAKEAQDDRHSALQLVKKGKQLHSSGLSITESRFKEAQDDRHSALQLVKKGKQLHSSGLSITESRFTVGDKAETS